MMKQLKAFLAAIVAFIFTFSSIVPVFAFDERDIDGRAITRRPVEQFQLEDFYSDQLLSAEPSEWDSEIQITRLTDEEWESLHDVRNFENADFVPGQVIVGFKPEPSELETLSSESIFLNVSEDYAATNDNTYAIPENEESAANEEFYYGKRFSDADDVLALENGELEASYEFHLA